MMLSAAQHNKMHNAHYTKLQLSKSSPLFVSTFYNSLPTFAWSSAFVQDSVESNVLKNYSFNYF